MRCRIPDRDLTQRLDQTICRYKGHPYYVRHGDMNTLYLYDLENRQTRLHVINKNDVELDISSVPLGYLQLNKYITCYVSRKPARIYKQGVTLDSLNVDPLPGDRASIINIYSKAFKDMILGNYPPLFQTVEMLRASPESMSVCISRDIALKWDPKFMLIYVYYKNEEAGWIPDRSHTVIVPGREQAWIVSKLLHGFGWEIQ